MKPLVYLKCVEANFFPVVRKKGFLKCRTSTLLSMYSCVMLLIFLFNGLAMIFGNVFNDNMDNVYTFATMMKSSAYVISHGCFHFSMLLFRVEIFYFLHVLLSFNSSIDFTFTAFDSNFNYMKVQTSVLVPLHTSSAFLIFSKFEMKHCPQLCLCVIMAISFLSINVLTVLFINWAVLLEGCFTRINTCLCELIWCAGEELVGLYRQIST